jgi:hypothetical protein
MTEDSCLLLSALIDREPVDADRLGEVLETPAGRALLVDFVRLRVLVREEPPGAAVAWARVRAEHVPHRIVLRTAAAVVVFAVGLAGGAWWKNSQEAQPPAPHRVVQFEPGVEWGSTPQE